MNVLFEVFVVGDPVHFTIWPGHEAIQRYMGQKDHLSHGSALLWLFILNTGRINQGRRKVLNEMDNFLWIAVRPVPQRGRVGQASARRSASESGSGGVDRHSQPRTSHRGWMRLFQAGLRRAERVQSGGWPWALGRLRTGTGAARCDPKVLEVDLAILR